MTALRPALLLFPLVTFAQVAPPPEVDQALRARVMEFAQYHIDAKFTKAWEMVAADTKEYYFSGTKNKYESFKIDKIEYTDNFTKAHVSFTYDRIWELRMQKTRVTASAAEDWKIEDGKWMWYHDQAKDFWPTPMGPSDPPEIQRRTAGAVQLPKDMSPDALVKKAQDIFKATQVDRSEVMLPLDKTSVERVTLHNGAPGGINIELDRGGEIPGLTLELDTTSVGMNKDAVLTISYKKPANTEAPQAHTVRLTVQPFNQVFEIHIKFAEPDKAN